MLGPSGNYIISSQLFGVNSTVTIIQIKHAKESFSLKKRERVSL